MYQVGAGREKVDLSNVVTLVLTLVLSSLLSICTCPIFTLPFHAERDAGGRAMSPHLSQEALHALTEGYFLSAVTLLSMTINPLLWDWMHYVTWAGTSLLLSLHTRRELSILHSCFDNCPIWLERPWEEFVQRTTLQGFAHSVAF